MADVIYKKGQSANLDDVTIADGQILVTEDTGEMYVDMSNGTRKKISDNDKQDKFGTVTVNPVSHETTINFMDEAKDVVYVNNAGVISITASDSLQLYGQNNGLSIHKDGIQLLSSNEQDESVTVTGVKTPTINSPDTDAANKKYVDDAANALDTKINSLTSGKLTREIVEALPPIEEGNETTIYMVGPKNDGTYDEYMKVQNGIVSESVSNVGNRYIIQPPLINFEQENGYYIIPDLTCKSVTGGTGQFNGTAASVSFGFNSNEEGERFTEFCQPNEIYTLKIKVNIDTTGIPNITEVKAYKTGPSYELIGNTSVDLSSKQDKFAEYDLVYNTWVPADTFQLGSNEKSYLSLTNGLASINGNARAQLGITGGVIELSEQTLNNKPILALTMSGAHPNRRITGVTSVEESYDVANKDYVDNEIVKSKYEILQTAIAGTDITQTNGPMISGIYTVIDVSNGGTSIRVKDPNGNSWTLTVQNTNLSFSQNDQLFITVSSIGSIVGEIVTIKEIEKQDKLQLIEEHIRHNTVELTGSIKTIEQRTQSNCEYMGGSGQSTGTEYTVVKISGNDTTATIYTTQAGLGFNFKYSGMLAMSIGDTFTLEKVDGTTGTLVKNDKFNIHINHKTTQSTDVTILGVKTPTTDSSDTVAANKAYVDSKAIFEDIGDGNGVTTNKTTIGFTNGVTLMGDNVEFNGSEIQLEKNGRTTIKGTSIDINGDGGLTALSISNNKVEVWGSDVDTLEDIYIPIVGAATPTASSPTNQVATKEYVDRLDNVLKDIRDVIRGGGTTEQTVAEIEQLITDYLETKTIEEVEA